MLESFMRTICGAAVVLCLAACSGGSDPPPPPPAPADNDRDTFATSVDCNDNDPAVWRTISAFADADRDGIGAGPSVSVCAGNGPPAGFSGTSTDCAADDASVHTPMLYAARDVDGDKVVAPSTGSVCGDGAALPATYFAGVGSDEPDCDDQNASLWRISSFYEDLDHDGIGHGAARAVCIGDNPPSGLVDLGFDCDPLSSTQWRMVATYTDLDGDGVGSGPLQPLCVGLGPPPGSSFLGFDPLDSLTDPNSTLVSDFDLNFQSLIVDSDGDDDDVLF